MAARLLRVPARVRKLLCRAVDRINVIVAIVKEIAHLFPWAGLARASSRPSASSKRGKAFVGLTVGWMQVQKRARQARGI